MKRFLIAFVVALGLAGCANDKSILLGGTSLTATINNPIGLNEQYEIEAAAATVRRTGLAYLQLRQCRASETASITNPCGRRAVKVQIQARSRQLTAALNSYRSAIKGNPTINAVSAALAVRKAISDYQAAIPGV